MPEILIVIPAYNEEGRIGGGGSGGAGNVPGI